MSLLKYAVIGAAVAYGIQQVTKKRATDGKSILDDLQERAPEWTDKAKQFSDQILDKVAPRTEGQETYQ
ncbi:YtxH domain-containing protein [Mucilaginibacter robiniae]|uniref:YtxH domain-containing protein n=1 Tax=Mucilaginibacter robiniae TaxID=2728022 RepID=A0A7L5DYY7_9SPHI|nr:YtxH domain-containing protein [Mucilaginibacter robiniae]QJD96332.1 YtxH domain-containing protein [Mucilaginibacter robiniae]